MGGVLMRVKLVRCPDCHMFFLAQWQTKRTICRFCGLHFQLHVSPKAKHFRPPRNRIIAAFDSLHGAREALAKLNAALIQGVKMSNEEARDLIFRLPPVQKEEP
jgi:protein-arginine kinase activator protein McsA